MAHDDRNEDVSRIAAEVAGLIAGELERAEDSSPLFEALARRCPPGQLCCRKGFSCAPEPIFRCETGFRCMNNFSGLTANV